MLPVVLLLIQENPPNREKEALLFTYYNKTDVTDCFNAIDGIAVLFFLDTFSFISGIRVTVPEDPLYNCKTCSLLFASNSA